MAIVAVGVLGCQVGCESTNAQGKSGSPRPAPVVLGEVTDEPLRVERRYLGEVWASSDAELSVAEAGRVRRVHVSEGARVKKGQVLVELDDQLARAELEEARARRKSSDVQQGQAELDAERYTLLERERAISELEAQRQRSTAESLGAEQASLEALVQARAEKVSRHRLVAPFDGVVTSRSVDPGDWLSPGEPAIGLLTEEHLEVLVRVPPSLLDRIDDIVRIAIQTDSSRGLEGSVEARLQGRVDALERETRTGLLRVVPTEVPRFLRAGSSVDVGFFLEREGELNLPADAIVAGAVGERVFKIEQDAAGMKVSPVPVEIIESGADRVLVRAEGLSPGQRVVVRGNERLRPGQAVSTEQVTRADASSSETIKDGSARTP